MNTIIKITLIFFLFSFELGAQCPTEGTLYLSGQDAIDDFTTNYPNCTVLNGNLSIYPNMDYSKLNNLVEINGELSIQFSDNNGVNLTGLENIRVVNTIKLWHAYGDVSFLGNIRVIRDDLIDWGSSLIDLDLFSNLDTLGGLICSRQSIYQDLSQITDFSGIQNVKGLKRLVIRSEDKSGDSYTITGFNNVDSLDVLDVHSNILGLNNLKYVGLYNASTIHPNPGLTNLEEINDFTLLGTPNQIPASIKTINKLTLGRRHEDPYTEYQCNIEDLQIFNNVEYMKEIQIKFSTLKSFAGLEKIKDLGMIKFWGSNGNSYAYDYKGVESFDGLQNLSHIGYLYVNFDFLKEGAILALPSLVSGSLEINSDGNGVHSSVINGQLSLPKLESSWALNINRVEDPFFPSMKEVTGTLSIINIQSDIDMFPKLDSLNNLYVRNSDIIGFNSLETIEGNITAPNWYQGTNTLGGLNNLTKIKGDLNCFGSIKGFEKLEQVDGLIALTISDTKLPFKNLTTVGDKLTIENCPNLESLEGLNNLISTKHLIIENNDNLSDCSALCNLFQADGVQGIIEFNHNPSACSSQSAIESECDDPNGFILRTQAQVDDFVVNYSNVSTITGNLVIGDHEAPFTTSDITDISGLAFLNTIIGDLYIRFNNSLANLTGLNNLSAVSGNVTIRNNDFLSDLRENEAITTGFESISQIGGDLQILENDALESLNGLENLSTVGGKMIISTNPNLSDCKGICNILENDGVQGTIFIAGNPSGCSNQADVEASCASDCFPIISNVPADVTIECDSTLSYPTDISADCDGESVEVLFNEIKTDGDCSDSYKLTRTWTATGSNGNSSTETQIVSVEDTTPPALHGVPEDYTEECDIIVYNPSNVTATDNCSTITSVDYEELHIEGTCANSYQLKRTWSATDDCGNISTKIQIVTIEDNNNPVLFDVPDDITLTCDEEIPAPATVTTIDACDMNAMVTLEETETGECPDKVVTRTWTVTDACGNTSIGVQTISFEEEDFSGFNLSSQSQVDDFITTHSGNSTISGDIIIGDNVTPFENSQITDISGLSFLQMINGNLYIGYNNDLESLKGLENLISVSGNIIITHNDILKKFRNGELVTVGFERLSTIGGGFELSNNLVLESLVGLEVLSTIGGNMTISTNTNLSDCNGICDLLENDGIQGSISITENPSGCSNQAEVEQSCMVGNEDLVNSNLVLISPNPVDDYLNISSLDGNEIYKVVIYNQFGQKVMRFTRNRKINVRILTKGMYLVKIKIGRQIVFHKFIKL